MNINFTSNADALMNGTKLMTTRYNLEHWRKWINHRRMDFLSFIDSPITECTEETIQHYLDNVASAVFEDYFDGGMSEYTQPDERVMPYKTLPILKAHYGSFRGRGPPAQFLGYVFLSRVMYKNAFDFTEEEAKLEGFPSVKDFLHKLKEIHYTRLEKRYGDADKGMKKHTWITMGYVWIEGPFHVQVFTKWRPKE